jgi:hypothetical protein
MSTFEDTSVVTEVVEPSLPHNNAMDSVLTRGIARFWDRVAEPLADNIYGPIAEWNHTAGVIAVNATLTAPRLAERALGNLYLDAIRNENKLLAVTALAGKAILKATDGLDGAVARRTGTSTEIGAGFDPLVDIMGTYDDTRVVKELARDEGDTLTIVLMDTRLAVDGLAIAAGGVGNTIATKVALAKGVELDEKENTSKSNAESKAKYAVGAVGAIALEASYLFKPESKPRTILKRSGQILSATAIGIGIKGVDGYTKSAVSKFKRAFVKKPAVE